MRSLHIIFPKEPEFYATYRMIDVKNHLACLFKAQTWEELQMLTQNDEYLQAAATSIRIANEEEIVREQCCAREDALRRERTLGRDNKICQEKYHTLQAENASLQDEYHVFNLFDLRILITQ